MNHPLDGAKRKVVWAEKHLSALQDEIGRYLDSHPYEIPTEHEGDVVAVRPAIVKVEPPLDLGCIFGDCLANLRACLDYIAWQLAVRFAATAPIVGKDRIQFPLARKAADFKPKPLADKHSFPASAISLIESVQPYQAGHEPLGLLNSLVNEDKHCLPLLTIAYANSASIEVRVAGPPAEIVMYQPAGSKAVIIGHASSGMIVQRLPADADPNDPSLLLKLMAEAVTTAGNTASPGTSEQQPRSVKVDGQVAVFVSLQNPLVPLEPIERTLEQLVKCVADIVPRFEPFFV
jgi:hypothetical protein